MDTPTYWEETSSNHHVKFESAASSSTEGSSLACKEEQSIYHYCDGNLNFATVATSEDDEYGFHKKKVSRDPMSHRIIEKRRRDRMNNCLADLSRLIPAEYLKKGRGRIEKTEIIEMAIRHMKHLQAHACRHADQCDLAQQQQPSPEEAAAEPPGAGGGGGGGGGGAGGGSGGGGAASAGAPGGPIVLEHYRLGYQECLSEAMHFMVEVEGFFAGDPLCVQLINHLQRHCERILKGDRLNFPRTHLGETTSSSGSSCGSGRGRSAGGGGGGGGGGSGGSGLGSSGLGSASASASGSGSSPGSCSDSGRAEPRDSGVGGGGGSGSAGRRGALAPLGLALSARHDDCYEEGAPAPAPAPPLGSQLRDMLTNAPADWRRHGDLLMFSLAAAGTGGLAPHPATLGVTSVIHNGSAPPLPPQQHQLPPASPGPAPDGAPGPLYKFKNNIKQRFSAEHHHSGAGGPLGAGGAPYGAPYGAPKRRRYASETEDGPGAAGGNLLSLSLHRRDSETCSVPSPPVSPPPLAQQPPASARSPLLPSPASSPPPVKFALAGAQPPPPAAAHGPPAPPARPVPIFALHSRGAYYVPLTLDADALAPYLAECGCACACGCEGAEAHGPCAPPVALHPVTISVNFSRAPASAPAPAPCARPAARHLGACGAPAAMVAPAPGLPWKVEPAPWKAEPGAFASPRWPEALPERG